MTHPEEDAASVPAELGRVSRLIDGGDMDCGSGLLLLITRAMRRLEPDDSLAIRSEERSVAVDLPVWADLAGHSITGQVVETDNGPWWFAVRKSPVPVESTSLFSQGRRTPVGDRLWAYTNFDCNLACQYCCAESSPKADARRLSPHVAREAFTAFAAGGGRELFLTGGEPFMHPDLGELVEAGAGLDRTILTNAMIFARGNRRRTLESLDRSVVLQVSLDSATPSRHDRQRGAGSWARAMAGIELARSLDFRVRVAATMYAEDAGEIAALNDRLDDVGIEPQDRLIRPVAQEGFATVGVHVSIDTLQPEPTITADGAWWHPVAVTNPNMRVADAPLPIEEVFAVVRDTLAVQDAATAAGRAVFRCA